MDKQYYEGERQYYLKEAKKYMEQSRNAIDDGDRKVYNSLAENAIIQAKYYNDKSKE